MGERRVERGSLVRVVVLGLQGWTIQRRLNVALYTDGRLRDSCAITERERLIPLGYSDRCWTWWTGV